MWSDCSVAGDVSRLFRSRQFLVTTYFLGLGSWQVRPFVSASTRAYFIPVRSATICPRASSSARARRPCRSLTCASVFSSLVPSTAALCSAVTRAFRSTSKAARSRSISSSRRAKLSTRNSTLANAVLAAQGGGCILRNVPEVKVLGPESLREKVRESLLAGINTI